MKRLQKSTWPSLNVVGRYDSLLTLLHYNTNTTGVSSSSIRYDSNASASDSSEGGEESEDESAKKKKAKKAKVVKEKKERKPRKEVREGLK